MVRKDVTRLIEERTMKRVRDGVLEARRKVEDMHTEVEDANTLDPKHRVHELFDAAWSALDELHGALMKLTR